MIIISFFAVFICIILLPTVISDEKKSEGYSGGHMFWIPEMYKKEFYKDSKLWIRTVLIYGQITFLSGFVMMYFLHLIGVES